MARFPPKKQQPDTESAKRAIRAELARIINDGGPSEPAAIQVRYDRAQLKRDRPGCAALRELDDAARTAIADFLIEELETTSADDNLAETRELYGDENALALRTQKIFEDTWQTVRPDDPLTGAKPAASSRLARFLLAASIILVAGASYLAGYLMLAPQKQSEPGGNISPAFSAIPRNVPSTDRSTADGGGSATDLAAISNAIQLDPTNARNYNERGILFYNRHNYGRALADFDKAIELSPQLAVAYNNRGVLRIVHGDYDRAIGDFNQAIRLAPDMALIYFNRAGAAYEKRDYQQAVTDYEETEKRDPHLAVEPGWLKFQKPSLEPLPPFTSSVSYPHAKSPLESR